MSKLVIVDLDELSGEPRYYAEMLGSPLRTGHWIKDEEMSIMFDIWTCSECGGGGDKHFKYCAYCGAKMDRNIIEKPFNRSDDCLSYEESFCKARDCGECCCRELKGENNE